MRSRSVIAGTIILAALAAAGMPAWALYDDTHYYLTYVTARLLNYTPEQAYRVAAADLAVDYNATTEGSQMSAEDFIAEADPDTPERQRVRWAFHAFIPTDQYPSGPENEISKRAMQIYEKQRETLDALSQRPNNLNPGAELHFEQCYQSHPGQRGTFERYLKARLTTDWLSFDSQTASRVAEVTELSLYGFAREALARPQLPNLAVETTDSLVRTLAQAAPRPAEFARDEQKYYEILMAQHNPRLPRPKVSIADEESLRGPAPAAVRLAAQGFLSRRGMREVIPDVDAARKLFKLDANGNVVPDMLDQYVLACSLRVTLQGGGEPVEVVVIAPARDGNKEYQLTTPSRTAVPSSKTWDKLPIGKVDVELRRGGKVMRRQKDVVLDKRENEIVLKLGGAPAVATGSVWVLKPGFPQINPDNAPLHWGAPAAAGVAWTEGAFELSPTRMTENVTLHAADGTQTVYSYQWVLSAEPPQELRLNQPVDINVTAQVTPASPPVSPTLGVTGGGGLKVWSDTVTGGSNAYVGVGHLGVWEGKTLLSDKDTIHFHPLVATSPLMELNIDLGGRRMHWEWQRQGEVPTAVQQPTAPVTPTTPKTTPTTPTSPATPTQSAGQPPTLGLNVKTQQGPNGQEIVVGTVDPNSPAGFVVEPGDVIVALDGVAVTSTAQVRDLLSKKKAGDDVRLKLRRGDIEMEVSVHLK